MASIDQIPIVGAGLAGARAAGRRTGRLRLNTTLPGVAKAIERLIRSRARVDVDALADPGVALDELAGGVLPGVH